MPAARYVKAPAEKKRYQLDYSDWLDTSEQVSGAVFSVDKVTAPPLVVDGVQVMPNGTGVQYYISGGVDGAAYNVIVTMTTTVGPQVKEDDIFVSVREPA